MNHNEKENLYYLKETGLDELQFLNNLCQRKSYFIIDFMIYI